MAWILRPIISRETTCISKDIQLLKPEIQDKLKAILELIKNARQVVLVGHVNADGDVIGGMSALFHRLQSRVETLLPILFEAIPDRDGYLIKCDGIEDDELYHFVIRVDSNGNWINDGRTKKTP